MLLVTSVEDFFSTGEHDSVGRGGGTGVGRGTGGPAVPDGYGAGLGGYALGDGEVDGSGDLMAEMAVEVELPLLLL